MFSGLFIGVIAIVVIILCTSFVISLLLKFTSLTEQSLTTTTMVISFAALFAGGIISGTKAKQHGMLIGAETGLIYGIIVFLIQYLGFDTSFSSKQIFIFVLYLIAAAFGGMIGVNLTENNKH